MTKRLPDFARVLADCGALTGDEIDAVLEIAYAMAVANGHASIDELGSFRVLAKHLKPSIEMSGLLDALSAKLDADESSGTVARAAAKRLERPVAREAAYKAAYTIAVFDLETNAEERDLDDLLVEVLGLAARVDELEAQVNASLGA